MRNRSVTNIKVIPKRKNNNKIKFPANEQPTTQLPINDSTLSPKNSQNPTITYKSEIYDNKSDFKGPDLYNPSNVIFVI